MLNNFYSGSPPAVYWQALYRSDLRRWICSGAGSGSLSTWRLWNDYGEHLPESLGVCSGTRTGSRFRCCLSDFICMDEIFKRTGFFISVLFLF